MTRWFEYTLLVSLGSCLSTFSALAQSPAFDVASVKHSVPGETGGRIQFLPGGRFSATNVPLNFLVQRLYGVRDFQVVGAPDMLVIIADGYAARYEIQAKAPDAATDVQTKEMVKALLAERFQLKVHRETKELPVYALIPAKGGMKITAASEGSDGTRGGVAFMDRGWLQGKNVPMQSLILALSESLDRPVVDKTNFKDGFDFRLSWTPDGSASNDGAGVCPASFAVLQGRFGPGPVPTNCPSIFTAVQEQLGLKLDAQKDAVEVLVIDLVERPSAN